MFDLANVFVFLVERFYNRAFSEQHFIHQTHWLYP